MGESRHTRETSVRTAGRWCLHCESALVESALKCPACGTVTERGKLESYPLMLEALLDGDGDTFAGTLEGIANLLVISGLDREHAATVDFLRRKASEVRAAIKAATGGES